MNHFGLQMSIVLDHCGLKSELHVSEARPENRYGFLRLGLKRARKVACFGMKLGQDLEEYPMAKEQNTPQLSYFIILA